MGEGRPLVLSLPCGHCQSYPPQCLGPGWVGVTLLLRQRLWAPVPKLKSQQRRRPCLSEVLLSLEWGWGAQGREPWAEAPSHPLQPGKGLSLHFPQTLASPLDSLLIPFPCCPALGPTTPLTNSFLHFSSQPGGTGTPPTSSPKRGWGELTPCLSLSFLSPSLLLPDISSRPRMGLEVSR